MRRAGPPTRLSEAERNAPIIGLAELFVGEGRPGNVATLRAALKIALRKGLWLGNIAAVIRTAFAPEYKPRTRFLTSGELQKLLAQLTGDRAARVAFIISTSACWGETERARREHVAQDEASVFIEGTKRASRRRTVPIVTEQQRSLLQYATKHAEGTDGMLFRPWGQGLPRYRAGLRSR